MTRRQTRAYGVAIPSRRQLSLEAMLRAFAWLVSNVVSMFRTIFNRPTRDWHTDEAHDDQLPTPGDQHQGQQSLKPSFSGKAAGRIPGIPVASTQGTTTHSPCATNQDAWDKPKHDSVIVLQTRNGPLAAFAGGTSCNMRATLSCHSRRGRAAHLRRRLRRRSEQTAIRNPEQHGQESAHAPPGYRFTCSARVRNDVARADSLI